MKKSSILIPLIFLITGFVTAYFIFNTPSKTQAKLIFSTVDQEAPLGSESNAANPFLPEKINVSNESRINNLENEINQIKQQLQQVSQTLNDAFRATQASTTLINTGRGNSKRLSSALTQRLYSFESLIRGGLDQITAEDIVRRKNNIELKRLELQDRATRNDYLNTQRYYNELEDINHDDVSLREELGDQRYDEYLFTSKQNNRVNIASVMLGSAAEEVGIKKGDVVLSYDNSRMFNWQELKDATTGGSLGEFVSINIYREGEIYSFTVPRGPLGIQLGATRLEPQ